MRFCTAILISCLIASMALPVHGATPGIIGDWSEPTGSIIRIEACGQQLCARIVHVSQQAPTSFDIHNPDETQRSRPLCGSVIGQGFHQTDSEHAEDGFLYDSKSGKTYHGSMHLNGEQLELRGYIGLKLFGRTETWNRVQHLSQACMTNNK